MDKQSQALDWSLLKPFLAVAETGSLSGAARQLAQSQPTIGRQIKQLEDALGLPLFDRHSRGFALTETGALLVEHAETMQAAAAQIGLIAAGQESAQGGTVRLTASDVMARHALPPILAKLRQDAPDVRIVLLPSDTSENLLFRDADIAVRMYRATQLDVITRQIAETPMGIYGAQSYLEQRGTPLVPEDLLTHDLVGYDQDERILVAMREMGWHATRDWFATRCDDQNTAWELVRQGCGIGFFQTRFADRDPSVRQVLPDLPLPSLPIWLATTDAMRKTPRIRRVWDALETGLKEMF